MNLSGLLDVGNVAALHHQGIPHLYVDVALVGLAGVSALLATVFASRLFFQKHIQAELTDAQKSNELLAVLVESQTRTIKEELRNIELLRSITEAANRAKDQDYIIIHAIEAICRYGGFEVGHCFLIDERGMLTSSRLWSDQATELFPNFVVASDSLRVKLGESLPGRVLASRAVEWVPGIAASNDLERRESALKDHLLGGVSLPLIVGATLIGTLEFFSTRQVQENPPLTNMLLNVGIQVGLAITRLRQEEGLSRAKAEADRANAAKTDFLANMSHELRTPLNSIIGLVHLLQETPLSATQQEMLHTVCDSSENLLEIVNDILDISKIENGSLELERLSFSPRHCVARVMNMLQPAIGNKRLQLQLHDETHGTDNVLGDPVRYIRILTNIIGNAIKYTEHGRVDVIYRATPRENHRVEVTLIVKDTGVGIAADKLDKVFEKFVQADTSTTRKYGGSGLGLAITKQLVELMHGTIALDSHLGVGSTFTVTIPFEAAGADMVEEEIFGVAAIQGTIPVAQARVLVAEDHPLNQALMHKLLPAMGFVHLTVVENGEEAVAAVRSGHYDLVLMDCHMPKLSGYDATRAIRKDEAGGTRHVPIIAMTANAMLGEREQCLRVGMDAYVAKPISRSLLREAMAQWIVFDVDASADAAASPPVAEPQVVTLDLTTLRGFTGGNQTLEREFAALFLGESERNLGVLRAQAVEGVSPLWQESAHSLKGGAATLGAMKLRAYCADAQAMEVASAPQRAAMLQLIEAEFKHVCEQLRQHELM